MLITIISDYTVKLLIRNKDICIIKNFLSFKYTKNYGAAWSIFEGKRFFLIIISIIFMVGIYLYSRYFKDNRRNKIAFGFLLGGLFGNLFDRLLYGYVRDFISLQFGSYYYPIFNIADIAIVIGVFLIIFAIVKKEDSYGKN